jgi:hypothetical protein
LLQVEAVEHIAPLPVLVDELVLVDVELELVEPLLDVLVDVEPWLEVEWPLLVEVDPPFPPEPELDPHEAAAATRAAQPNP